jgi:hypothetical protein
MAPVKELRAGWFQCSLKQTYLPFGYFDKRDSKIA